VTDNPNDAWVESWMLALHDRSPSTRREYCKVLRYFMTWLATSDRTSDLLTVRRQDAEAWFTDMAAAGTAQNTRRARWVALKSFYGWLADEEEIDTNPMAKVKVARAVETPPPVVALDDLKRLLKACEGKGFRERRDLALIRTYLATGCRLSEVAMLTVPDVDLTARVVHVMGKGSKPRVARFDTATAAAIDRYRRTRARHRAAAKPWLWLGTKGRLTASGIDAMLRKRAGEAGLEGFHAHLLRHTWADAWKSKGGSESDLMKLGGWEDPTIMRRYGAARDVDRALAAYDDIDPMGGL
jgi:site-specific recombinase XerD